MYAGNYATGIPQDLDVTLSAAAGGSVTFTLTSNSWQTYEEPVPSFTPVPVAQFSCDIWWMDEKASILGPKIEISSLEVCVTGS
jgi:hypothetical protein